MGRNFNARGSAKSIKASKTVLLTQDTSRNLLITDTHCRYEFRDLLSLELSPMRSAEHVKSNMLKQRNGFPPNFIHSLDSSHMKLTALYLWNQGVTFASVHDCYWTHPATVEVMNTVCR